MTALNRNDMLASNLLFVTLCLMLAERAFWGLVEYLYLPAEHNEWQKSATKTLLVEVAFKFAFYYAIRRGMLRAKVVVLAVCIYLAYTDTHWQIGFVAGVNFADLWGYPLVVLAKDLITLAALVLMFRKPRVAPA
jgi:hypothetical protein